MPVERANCIFDPLNRADWIPRVELRLVEALPAFEHLWQLVMEHSKLRRSEAPAQKLKAVNGRNVYSTDAR